MSLLLFTTWFGTFLIDRENGELKSKILFPKTIEDLVQRLIRIRNQEILNEEKELIKDINEPIVVTEERLTPLGEHLGLEVDIPVDLELEPEDFGFDSELYHQAVLELGRTRSRGSIPKDFYIVQAVKGLDDLTQTYNLLSERLHEWYGLHWPELNVLVKDNEYVNLVSEFGDRDNIIKETNNEKLKKFIPNTSVGSELAVEDRSAVMAFGLELKNVNSSKTKLENYINSRMEHLAPNITSLIGPILGARLIALTGGLERLSRVSSSTIQLLGAEKALFRHLREGGRPPKHGIIFQHPLVHNAPSWQRGKIARAFAGKIAIAAKLDYNRGKFLGESLMEELKLRLEEIRVKYPNAPVKKKGSKSEGAEKWNQKRSEKWTGRRDRGGQGGAGSGNVRRDRWRGKKGGKKGKKYRGR